MINIVSNFSHNLSPAQYLICTALVTTDINDSEILITQLLSKNDNEQLFIFAKDNEVESILIHSFLCKKMHSYIPSTWLTLYEQMANRITWYLAELDRISLLFIEHGILLVALKNGGIVRGIYPYPGACPMGDLDVLVEKNHFRQAHQILVEQGYHFEFRSPLEAAEIENAEESGGAEYWKTLPSGEKFWLELQWRPVAGRWIRPDQEPSAKELMARSIPINSTCVRLLAPEDNLLQVSLHTAKHTYVRAPGFRLHLDVERIVRAYPDLDWNVFLEQVKRLQVETAVYFSLVIPYELFGTPIPERVLRELRPSAWKEATLRRWIQKAGLFNPHEKKFSRIKYILFTALLYDDFSGLLRGIFPDRKWMQEHYQFHTQFLLPYYHIYRLGNLLFRRLAT